MTRQRRTTRAGNWQPAYRAQQADAALAASHPPGQDTRQPDRRGHAWPELGETITSTWPSVGGAVSPGVLDAVTRALTDVLAAVAAATGPMTGPADDSQLLDVDQAAELLQVSRMTVIRLVDEGQLPAIVVRRGKVQKIRRIPRAFVQGMIAGAAAGQRIEMGTSAAAWRAGHVQNPDPPDAAGGAAGPGHP